LEWWLVLLFFFGGLFVLMASGMPVAFGFMLLNMIGVIVFWGGEIGLRQLGLSIYASLTNFALLPLPLFVLMGEVMFQSGMGFRMLSTLDKWMGNFPGRVSLLAVGGGVALSMLSGVSMASAAILGSTLVPEMERRGYKKSMSLGPIMASGALATMIPPSGLAVILGALAHISIASLLISGIIPGLLMALLYGTYIVVRCHFQPSIAPSYRVPAVPLSEKVKDTVKYVLPLGSIIFLVTGLILVGVVSPSEAAATGTLGTFVLAACYGNLNWKVVKKALGVTINITIMILMIIAGATAFSQILTFSGATAGLVELVTRLRVTPLLILIAMQIIILALGTSMELVSIMMITLPIFMPIVNAVGFNPVWFGVIMLLNLEMGAASPPFGMMLFVMKGVAPPDTTMGDIYRAVIPFLCIDLIVMSLIVEFPPLALWLPGVLQ
jgi:tripartite ATP-independent transporter DctM subunit